MSAERVREYYRKQGEARKQQQIIQLIEKIMDNYEPGSEEFDVLHDLVATIKDQIAPCIWCGLKEMDIYASSNGKNICITCEEKALEGASK